MTSTNNITENNITENMIGPTEKQDLPPCWTEVIENGSYYYLRANTYYPTYSIPEVREGYILHKLGDKNYIVKDKPNKNQPIKTLDEIMETTNGKILKSFVFDYMRETGIHTFEYVYGTTDETKPLNIHDVFVRLSQNIEFTLQILKYIEVKINQKIDNGEISDIDMWYMMNDIAEQLGIYTDDDYNTIWDMIHREKNIIGPIDHKMVLMPFWDEIVDTNGNYYYLQQGKYALCPDEIAGPHEVILIGEKSYFVMMEA
jgi:hypothetical protein